MFSELVDEVNDEARRGVDLVQIIAFANSTIKECQTEKGILFRRDMVEDTATTSTANPYIWQRPTRFRHMRAVQYLTAGIWPDFVEPGKKIKNLTHYFYMASTYFTFFGAGENAVINFAYFLYSRRFKYYTGLVADLRPAVYDRELETWSYSATHGVDDTTKALGEDLVSNWLLLDWYDTIKEGTMAKVLKRVGDEKTPITFASYKAMQKVLLETEGSITLNLAQTGGDRF